MGRVKTRLRPSLARPRSRRHRRAPPACSDRSLRGPRARSEGSAGSRPPERTRRALGPGPRSCRSEVRRVPAGAPLSRASSWRVEAGVLGQSQQRRDTLRPMARLHDRPRQRVDPRDDGPRAGSSPRTPRARGVQGALAGRMREPSASTTTKSTPSCQQSGGHIRRAAPGLLALDLADELILNQHSRNVGENAGL